MTTALGTRQYLRICNVKVFDKQGAGRDYTGLRCKFEIEKTSESLPNASKIDIFNLNQDSRTFVEGDETSIEISAGYPNALEIIGTGQVVSPNKTVSRQKHPDWITTIEFTDGGKALRGKSH